jgi:hypothetical protein
MPVASATMNDWSVAVAPATLRVVLTLSTDATPVVIASVALSSSDVARNAVTVGALGRPSIAS